MKMQGGFVSMAHVLLAFIPLGFVAIVGCYKGASQSDLVQVIDTQMSTSHHVAMLVERSDNAALSGPTFFVFVSERAYSLPELRSRLYALDSVFTVGRGGITLHWDEPNTLTIHCSDCGITADIIEKKIFTQGSVKIRYTGFP
jgi:hypothetical protein